MEINTFDIVQVDFGNVEFAGEQGGKKTMCYLAE